MALSVNTNIAALNAYRNLSSTQNDLSKSLEKLSSGLRINRAADDAAGLAISEGLRAQIGGTTQAVRNAQDGISVVQTAEGALTETASILQRMRTLSVQASNEGGLSDTAKSNIQDELSELKTELTRIADTTTFNGKKLLDGNYSGSFQVGANTSAQDKINVKIQTADGQGLSTAGLGLAGVDVTAVASNATTGTNTTDAESGVSGVLTLGAATDYSDDSTAVEAYKGLNGTITIGGKSLDLTSVKYDTATNAATAQAALQTALDTAFGAGTATADASGAAGIEITTAAVTGTAAEIAKGEASFEQASGASEAIDLIDAAITSVSQVRSSLGAVQNRFGNTINNLNVAVENLTASESRIRDTDMASEMVSYTRASILSQAGTAMLAQAKNLPQSVLQLLQ